MKLVIAVIQNQDAPSLLKALTNENFQVTKLSSTGGFLRQGNTTLLIGCQDDQVQHIISIVKQICSTRDQVIMGTTGEFYDLQPVEVTVGGATLFVVAVEAFKQV